MCHKAYRTRMVRRVQGSANLEELATGTSLFHNLFASQPSYICYNGTDISC